MKHIREPVRQTPVREDVDVLVVGGGLGGVSAAVAAARAGARTLLVERNGFPGGVATAGMCCSVFNCLYSPSHELVVRGNSLEFVEALARAEGPGSGWHDHKGHIIFDIERGKLALIELLERAGVSYLFDTVACDVIMSGRTVTGIMVESKSGREAILAKSVVDATGDSDIAFRANAPLTSDRYIHSYCFRIGNVDVDRFIQYFIDNPGQYPPYMDIDWEFSEALEQYKRTGTFLFPHGGGIQLDLIKEGISRGEYKERLGVHEGLNALQMHAIRDLGVVHVVTGVCYLPKNLDVGAITRAMSDGKRMAFHVTEYFRKHVPGFANAIVIATADDLGIRASRWLKSDFVFTRQMKQNRTEFDDAIGRGVVEIDCRKNESPGAWGVQTFREGSFGIPYRCLLPDNIDGLIMGSGRSASVENPWLLRVMALTMIVGQGAGVGAAVSAEQNVPPHAADIRRVQEILRIQGVVLDPC